MKSSEGSPDGHAGSLPIKKERVRQAELEKEIIASSEIQYLQKAYEKIQEAVRRFDREHNEEISKAIESKEACSAGAMRLYPRSCRREKAPEEFPTAVTMPR